MFETLWPEQGDSHVENGAFLHSGMEGFYARFHRFYGSIYHLNVF